MTSVVIPGLDLVPSLPSRVVTVDLVDMTEGEQVAGAKIDFFLPADLHVPADDKILQAGRVTLTLNANGHGEIRLPAYTDTVHPVDWVIGVKKHWAPHPYYIRVPAGSTKISLADIDAVHKLPPDVLNWIITGVSLTMSEGAVMDGTAKISGGILDLDLTFPPGARAVLRGRVEAGGNPDLWKSSDARQGQWDIVNTSDANALITAGYTAPLGATPHTLTHIDDITGIGGSTQQAIVNSTSGRRIFYRFRSAGAAFSPWVEAPLEGTPKAFIWNGAVVGANRNPDSWTDSATQGWHDAGNTSTINAMLAAGYTPPYGSAPHIFGHFVSHGGEQHEFALIGGNRHRIMWRARRYNQPNWDQWQPVNVSPQEATRPERFLAVGDSWVQGGSHGVLWPDSDVWVHKLGQALGVVAENAGRGGEHIDETLLRAGRKEMWVKVSGGSIPASGAVGVTLSWQPETDGARWFSQRGQVNGINVFLECNGTTGAWTIRRESAGSAIPAAGWQFWLSDLEAHSSNNLVILRSGNNDVSHGTRGGRTNTVDHVVSGILTFAESLPLRGQHFIWLPLMPHADPAMTAYRDTVLEINRQVRAVIPHRTWDVYKYMRDLGPNGALADMGITPTQADLDMIDNGFPPQSCYDPGDNGHANKAFHTALANRLATYITARGLVRA